MSEDCSKIMDTSMIQWFSNEGLEFHIDIHVRHCESKVVKGILLICHKMSLRLEIDTDGDKNKMKPIFSSRNSVVLSFCC
jgi:hypothetical protein